MTQPPLFTFANARPVERKIIRESQHFENEAKAKQYAIECHNSGKYAAVEFCYRTVAMEREE